MQKLKAANFSKAIGLFLFFTAALCVAGAALAPASIRPVGAKPLSATMPEDALQFYKDRDFKDNMTQISDVTTKQSWRALEIEGKADNRVSSVRWNLPRSVVVSLNETENGLGRTLFIFGSGEFDSLKPWKMHNKTSVWSWNYVGAMQSPPKRILDALAPRPRFAKECEPIPADSIQLFKDRECKGSMTAMEKVCSQSQGVFKDMPTRKASSMKWNLPEGIMVVFSGGSNGERQQLAIWGKGMFESFHMWELNDKITQFAWYNVGEEPKAPQTAPAH